MHVHTTFVKLKDPATVAQCRGAMESMRGRIDYMLGLRVDENMLVGNYSCDLAITTVWPDTAAYQTYESDPVHLEVRSVVAELMSDAMTIDYVAADSVGDVAGE
jgi:hypothetical protein